MVGQQRAQVCLQPFVVQSSNSGEKKKKREEKQAEKQRKRKESRMANGRAESIANLHPSPILIPLEVAMVSVSALSCPATGSHPHPIRTRMIPCPTCVAPLQYFSTSIPRISCSRAFCTFTALFSASFPLVLLCVFPSSFLHLPSGLLFASERLTPVFTRYIPCDQARLATPAFAYPKTIFTTRLYTITGLGSPPLALFRIQKYAWNQNRLC